MDRIFLEGETNVTKRVNKNSMASRKRPCTVVSTVGLILYYHSSVLVKLKLSSMNYFEKVLGRAGIFVPK